MAIEHRTEILSQLTLHVACSGDGDPVVLLHGWPQTWHEWRKVIPLLAPHHRLFMTDLPGLGDSTPSPDGYAKQRLAAHLLELADRLGIERFHLVGHDWGGPTAYALAAGHPEAVRRLVILDVVIPGSGGDFSEGGRRWHHQFHMTPDLPEALVQGREDVYLAWFYRTFAYRPDAIGPDDLAEYLRTYRQPGAMRAGFAFYRAIAQDAADNQAAIARLKLPMPVLAMGGAVSYPHGRGRGSEPEQSLRRVAVDVRGEVVPDCGHFIPEEAPDFLNARLLAFFD